MIGSPVLVRMREQAACQTDNRLFSVDCALFQQARNILLQAVATRCFQA